MSDAEGVQLPSDDPAGIDPDEPGVLARLLNRWRKGDGEEDDGAAQDGPPGGVPNGPAVPGLSNLRRMRVEDVAVPVVEIVAVDLAISLEELIRIFRESGFSRLPVYDGTLDTPLGMVHLKDVALHYGFNGHSDDEFDLRAILRPILYAPPSMPIGVLLQKMQSQRRHMALVIDEYGGTDGLLTIEDLIEQVIGEIEDEHDEVEADPWRQESPGSFIALARAPLPEFEAAIGRRLSGPDFEEEVDTLGGLVFILTGRVPARGEIVPHPQAAVEFDILDADPRTIKRMRVRLLDDRPGED
ncbi:hemolysin family protein [Mangrovicoccus algicola]|uniref:HlyC/CorC family transporter n=1 Tax=Mangrovicoccus algicola TaxID=2771008 RepID=A0A8J7CYP5_9RHOB|nr:hemolysin family protein [Mangrovicoccus algicola]MBE3639822.1 HlyC/CorC family transporter [Mangrovicoccus algicola]